MSDTLEKVKARLAKRSAQVQAFMDSEIGKAIIEALDAEFYDGNLFDPDPHVTAYNLGRRDVVVYLKQLQTWRPKK